MKTIKRITRSIISLCIVLAISIVANKTYAAELAVSANGNNVTISSQYTGKVNISVSGGTASQSSVWLENSSETITISGVSSSGATVTVTPATMSDSDGNAKSVSAKSVKIAGSGNASSRDNTTTNKTDSNKTNTDKTEKKDPTFKSANDTMYATGDINVRKSYSADSDKLGSLKAGEKVTRTGIGDNGWSKVSFNGGTGYIKTSLLTDKEPKKSEDKALKSLSIEGVELNPEFDPEITDYAVTFDGKDKLDIKAEANDEKSKVEITGNEALKDGDNTIKITVTAEDGTTRLYTIIATKGDAKAGLLKSLKVAGYTLSPAFSADVKEYKISILDANVNSIDVTAESSLEKAKVEVTGNTGLKEGDNTVLVKITSEDGTKTDTYKIIVTKKSSNAAAGTTNNNDSKSNWILYAGIAIIAILIIAIIVVIIMSKRNAYYDEDEEYDEEDEDGNENKAQDDYSDLYGYSTKSDVKNSEPSVDEKNEKDQFLNDSIYGDFSAKANNERAAEEEAPKYEDGFNYNAFNSKDMYETPAESNEGTRLPDYDNFHAPADDVGVEPSEIKDVDYYSNKVSEMFDKVDENIDNPASDLSSADSQADSNNYPSTDWDDDYRPRRSKGKHAK